MVFEDTDLILGFDVVSSLIEFSCILSPIIYALIANLQGLTDASRLETYRTLSR